MTTASAKPAISVTPERGQRLGDTCFIETQFPVSKMSMESFAERTAKQSQTLTGLGKWWGRKPLVLCRATILGLLLPATDDPQRDREVFLRLMTMDDDGMLRRKSVSIPAKELFRRLPPSEHPLWFQAGSTEDSAKLKRGVPKEDRNALQRRVFLSMSYDARLRYCDRPEQVDGPSLASWKVINAHLGTTATTIPGLVAELGTRRFGDLPRVGDSFCGGGSIPFEAARIGCATYASDLNPVAALLTWAALNIVGAGADVVEHVKAVQRKVFDAVDRQLIEWGIEHNAQGWRADAFLYCIEVKDPESGWRIPLAPSWVIGEGTRTVAKLIPDPANKRFRIEVASHVSSEELKEAAASGTVADYRLVPPPGLGSSTPIESLARTPRVWTSDQVAPGPDDVFQERLFCIRWVETYYLLERGGSVVELSKAEAEALPDFDSLLASEVLKLRTRRHYRAPTPEDERHDSKVSALLAQRMPRWQQDGIIPVRPIQRGKDINRPSNARGWSYWHHFFNPRQLLVNGLLSEQVATTLRASRDRVGATAAMLSIGRVADWNSRQSRWDSSPANEKGAQTFYKPSLATPLFNYCCRGLQALDTSFMSGMPSAPVVGASQLVLGDAREIEAQSDIWITDPPYADAVNYHELSEYFLAWYEKRLLELFPEWYVDSKRALAIKADNADSFRESMVACYRRLADRMPACGLQVVMFTHQDASVWADLTTILWAAGLQVTSAWCIATETEAGGIKSGNYVQGTVLLVLRKQTSAEVAFLDEVYQEIEADVRRQLDSMRDLDDARDPNFGDTDYQLAAYAAALRVLTSKKIEEIDVSYELTRKRGKGEKSKVEEIIEKAVKIACDHLVPIGIDPHLWKGLGALERLYLKGLEIESHGERRQGVYQELARGFGVEEYKNLLGSAKANETRLKTPTEFGRKEMGDAGFASSLVRHALFATLKTAETEGTRDGITWFKTEVPDYGANRQRLIDLLDYFAAIGSNASMEHWHKDAHAAGLLAGALRNRQDNV